MSESDLAVIIQHLNQLDRTIEKAVDAIEKVNDAVGKLTEKSARNSQRIKTVEGSVELAHTRISGVKKWIFGGLIAIVSTVAKHVWSLIESASGR